MFTSIIFGARPETRWLGGVVRAIKCWMQDGLYDSNLLQDTLISQFGDNQRMFGAHNIYDAVKIGVTACSTKDSLARVFTNYNGCGVRRKNSGASFFLQMPRY